MSRRDLSACLAHHCARQTRMSAPPLRVGDRNVCPTIACGGQGCLPHHCVWGTRMSAPPLRVGDRNVCPTIACGGQECLPHHSVWGTAMSAQHVIPADRTRKTPLCNLCLPHHGRHHLPGDGGAGIPACQLLPDRNVWPARPRRAPAGSGAARDTTPGRWERQPLPPRLVSTPRGISPCRSPHAPSLSRFPAHVCLPRPDIGHTYSTVSPRTA